MATKRSSSLARIRPRPIVGPASWLMEGRVAGAVFELPVRGPVRTPVTIAEKATLTQEAMVEDAQATHATAREIVTDPQRLHQTEAALRRGFSGASVFTTPGQKSVRRPSC